MEDLEIGMRFNSYEELLDILDSYCKKHQCKFWKRDARTITASRGVGICKYINPDLIYYEIKYSCIYGGMSFKPKTNHMRKRLPSLKCRGCLSHVRFRASEDGDALVLVAMNLNHNHALKLPKSIAKKQKSASTSRGRGRGRGRRGRKAKALKESETEDNLEIEEQESESNSMVMDNDENSSVAQEPFTFKGLIAPVFTPFDDDLSLNLDIIPTYAQYLLDLGIEGVLVNGTTGEGMSMNTTERKLVTEAWAQTCSETQQHLMVQIGGAPLPDVIELAQHAESHGVSSLLCLPELYHKPTTCNDLIQYLQIVSSAAPNTPLLYYHIPSLTNVNIHMGKLLNEMADQIPTFSGIKFTSTVLDEGVAALKAHDKKFTVFLGADTIMAGAYALGFDSAIATTLNIFPQFGQNILENIQTGNVKEAMETQEKLNNAIEVITRYGTWVPTMKEAMNLLTAINVGPIRGPLQPMLAEHITQMEEDLKALNIFD